MNDKGVGERVVVCCFPSLNILEYDDDDEEDEEDEDEEDEEEEEGEEGEEGDIAPTLDKKIENNEKHKSDVTERNYSEEKKNKELTDLVLSSSPTYPSATDYNTMMINKRRASLIKKRKEKVGIDKEKEKKEEKLSNEIIHDINKIKIENENENINENENNNINENNNRKSKENVRRSRRGSANGFLFSRGNSGRVKDIPVLQKRGHGYYSNITCVTAGDRVEERTRTGKECVLCCVVLCCVLCRAVLCWVCCLPSYTFVVFSLFVL